MVSRTHTGTKLYLTLASCSLSVYCKVHTKETMVTVKDIRCCISKACLSAESSWSQLLLLLREDVSRSAAASQLLTRIHDATLIYLGRTSRAHCTPAFGASHSSVNSHLRMLRQHLPICRLLQSCTLSAILCKCCLI